MDKVRNREICRKIGAHARPEDVAAGQEMAEQLAQFVNTFNTVRMEACAQAMVHQHRTLQQSMTRMFLRFMELQAQEDDYDLRNQASIRLARKIVKLVEDEQACLPMV